MDPVCIIIPFDIRPWTKNAIQWRKKRRGMRVQTTDPYRAKIEEAKHIARTEWIRAGKPQLEGRVRLDIHVVRSSPSFLDEPNIWWGLSGFIDGAFIKGITPDDKPKYLKCGEITQVAAAVARHHEYFVMKATPLERQTEGLFDAKGKAEA